MTKQKPDARIPHYSDPVFESPAEYCSKNLARFFSPFGRLNNARRLRKLPRAEAAVLHSLNAHADKNGAGFLKAKTIAAETGYERNAISRGYKFICERGYVRRVQLKTRYAQNGVFAYAVLMPLRLCELGVRYLDAEPCNPRQQHNSPVQQHNINADQLFAFEATLMDRMWRHIDFDETPKLISVMSVSKIVFATDPSMWGALKAYAIQTVDDLAERLTEYDETFKDWAVVAKSVKTHSIELTKGQNELPKMTASEMEQTDEIAQFLKQQLNSGQCFDRSLRAALNDIRSFVTDEEILIGSVSLRTIDIVERECAGSLKDLGRAQRKRVILSNGEISRMVYQPRPPGHAQ